jgi:hypothetical protein
VKYGRREAEAQQELSPISHTPTSHLQALTSILPPSPVRWSTRLETHGPLGTLIVGFGLCAFYIALIWLNTLLGVFLTPLFIIPGTWLLAWLQSRRRGEAKARR